MSISEMHPRPGPGVVLSEVVQLVRELDETRWSGLGDDELVSVVEQVESARSALAAVQAGAVTEVDDRGVAKTRLHYGSTGDWLTHLGGLRKGAGRRLVERAHALTGPLRATRLGMLAGLVSPEQADVIVQAVEDLPSGEAVRSRGEVALLEHAGSLDATLLARTGRHLVQVVDPDATERRLERELDREERAAHVHRSLAIVSDGAGGVRVKGRGSAEDGALLKAALLPLTSPAPAADDDDGQLVHDPRDHGARMWDAWVCTAQKSLDTDLPPECHGAPARLAVTVDLDTLRDGNGDGDGEGVGVANDGSELSPATVRRLACDAELIPAVLGSRGEVLDVGRSRRLVTPAIWTALVLRDGHCAFPACERPPVMCHAHHIVSWLELGPTALNNLVLLCGHHHRVIHHSPWQIRINPDDGRPEFLPPPRAGGAPQWIRRRPRSRGS